ncbi:Organ specific protein [Dillenia turbinata]|uniref:Organ specific protein n=1 Tax=Dillenia turbinata TaxID=194707 RepID=A0AAN8UJ50_9MAGN
MKLNVPASQSEKSLPTSCREMESAYAVFIAFSVLLIVTLYEQFAGIINARNSPAEYWKAVMNDQPMPEAIKGLINQDPATVLSDENEDCHTSSKMKKGDWFVREFETRPNVIIYHRHEEPKRTTHTKEIEPRLDTSVFHDHVD